MRENNIREVWDEKVKDRVIGEHEEEGLRSNIWVREHEDMARNVRNVINPMAIPKLDEERMRELIRGLKNNKAAGPDGIRGEWFKELGERRVCLESITRCLDEVTRGGEVPAEWKLSRTTLIKKVARPTGRDYRPIAVMGVESKLYMSFVRGEIEEHLRRNGIGRDNQIGFMEGGRIEYAHFLLQYMVEDSLREKKGKRGLVVMALDYSKAYDSIERKGLVETMIKYKLNPFIIDVIVKLYEDDETLMRIGGKEERVKVTSGIRQGCTASTELFKLVTFEIIRKLEEEGEVMEFGNINLNSLFFADDSLTVAKTVEEAERNLGVIREASRAFGLEINLRKSKAMIYRKGRRVAEERGGDRRYQSGEAAEIPGD